MKVYVRTSDLDGERPRVLAFYADNISVPDNAHGDGVTILMLPEGLVKRARRGEPNGYRLIEDWRARAGSLPVEMEAKRRIEEAFTAADQIIALRELVDAILKYGADASKWPPDVTARKAEIDEKFNYVGSVRERARAQGVIVPNDPGSDKVWPTRIVKRLGQ